MPNSDELIAELRALTPVLRSGTRQADRIARQPEDLARILTERGLYKLWVPTRYGGSELDLPSVLRVYEAAAYVDGSIGWAVMIGTGGGLFAAYLEPGSAEEMFSRYDALVAGSGHPTGTAERVEGGYRATGRWRFASGAHYATTFTANCIVTDNGKSVLDAAGQPLIRAMAFEPSQVSIIETWDTTGMRGTGSHDIEVSDAFVPERRTFSVFTDMPREPGPLYRLPFEVLTELPVTAVALGIARHALDAFAELSRVKKAYGADTELARDPVVQANYAEARAAWRVAKCAVEALSQEAWQSTVEETVLTDEQRAEITASCAYINATLRSRLSEIVALAGMTAGEQNHELSRAWRDLQVLGAHGSVAPRQLTVAGQMMIAPDYAIA